MLAHVDKTSTARSRKFRRLRRLAREEAKVEIDGVVLAMLIRGGYLTEEESENTTSINAALTAYIMDSSHGRIHVRCPRCGHEHIGWSSA
jgi:hypothetical protein